MNTKQGPHGQRFLSIFKSKGHGRAGERAAMAYTLFGGLCRYSPHPPVVTQAFHIAVPLYLHFRDNFKVCSSSNFHLLKRHWHE